MKQHTIFKLYYSYKCWTCAKLCEAFMFLIENIYSTDYVICPPVHAFSFHVTIVHFTYYAYVSPHDISLIKFKVKY